MVGKETRRTLLGVVLALLLVGAVAPAMAQAAPRQPNVVGGELAPGDYPWMVALEDTNGRTNYCGGVLIAPSWVLTAAHCAVSDTVGRLVRIGSKDRSAGGTQERIARVLPYPGYDTQTGNNDIGLLKLAAPVPDANTIKLTHETDWDGRTLRLLGWGQTCPEEGCDKGSTLLRQLDLTVLTSRTCRDDHISFDPGTDLCLDTDTSHTPCFRDSGGPYVDPGSGRLVGVVSRGYPGDCGIESELATRVTAFQNWIYTNVPESADNAEIASKYSGQCLTANGRNLELRDCQGGSDQQWTYNTATEQLKVYDTTCLTAAGNLTSAGLANCDGSTSQQWDVNSNGTITPDHSSGYCLSTVDSGSSHLLSPCRVTANRTWSVQATG